MNVKSIERNGNEATIVVEIDKELMEPERQELPLELHNRSCFLKWS